MVVCPEITLLFHRVLRGTSLEWRDKVIHPFSLPLFLGPLRNLLKKSSANTRPRISRFTRRSLAPARARERKSSERRDSLDERTNERTNGRTDRRTTDAPASAKRLQPPTAINFHRRIPLSIFYDTRTRRREARDRRGLGEGEGMS